MRLHWEMSIVWYRLCLPGVFNPVFFFNLSTSAPRRCLWAEIKHLA